MNNSPRPIARKVGLVIQEMPNEILVFDIETNKAHCLNETAAIVWRACDGKNSVKDITKLFGNQSGGPVQEDLIWLAIDQLNKNNLLAEELRADFNTQSRREAIKKIGMAAIVALPIITSLVAPPAAAANSRPEGAVDSCNGSFTNGYSCINPVCNEAGGQPSKYGVCSGNVCLGCEKSPIIGGGTPQPR